MKYGVFFLAMACMAAIAATQTESPIGRIAWLSIIPALLLVAAAYIWNRPGLLFKRPDGNRPWWAWLLLWPYFGLVWLALWSYSRIDCRSPSTEVAPGLWLSRRLTGGEARRSGISWAAVIDMAAEFSRTPLPAAAYLSLPVLDGTPPTIEQPQTAVEWLTAHRAKGPLLVHCALGHGRSASVIIAWLMSNGQAADVPSALAQLQRVRPGVGLNRSQAKRLDGLRAAPNTD